MAAVIEVRTYRTQPGQRDKLMELLRTRAVPVHQELGMRILGPFPSVDDPDTFVWLRAFPDAASRDPMKEAFYGGRPWVEELEPLMMPLIAEYGAVVVEDTADLWRRWPEPSA
jgi:quinol monooxygenase YgiN